MKIGIDCRLWSQSGVGRYLRNLVQWLIVLDTENEYTLFVQNQDDAQKFKTHPDLIGTKLKIVQTDIKWHTLKEQIEFPQILNKENLDLMHFPYFSVPILYNKPFVITIHDLILHHFSTGKASTLPPPLYKAKHLFYKYIIHKAAKKAKKIIAVSNSTKKEIEEHLHADPEKIEVIYEGCDQRIQNSEFIIQNIKRFDIKPKKYFLYVGNAYPHKNLERLIDAFEIAVQKNNSVKLVLVGKEDYFYKRLKQKVINSKISDSIIFFGEANDKELSLLYKNAIALVFPSLMEGFGLPLIEAMENRCLILASDIPVFKEICRDVPLYFSPESVSDIFEKMNDTYLNNSKYEEKIRLGIKRSKDFSWKKMASETLQLYSSVI